MSATDRRRAVLEGVAFGPESGEQARLRALELLERLDERENVWAGVSPNRRRVCRRSSESLPGKPLESNDGKQRRMRRRAEYQKRRCCAVGLPTATGGEPPGSPYKQGVTGSSPVPPIFAQSPASVNRPSLRVRADAPAPPPEPGCGRRACSRSVGCATQRSSG
jgi:hypothetical protein